MKTYLFRTVIVITLACFILSKSGFCQITEPVWSGSVKHYSHTTGLEIDGYDSESFWSESMPVDGLFTSPEDFGGETDLSGYFKMFYTSYAFYFFASITDDIAHNFNGEDGNVWEFDHVELFFNLDTTNTFQSGLYFPDGIQLFFCRGLDNNDGTPLFGNNESPKTGFNNPSLKYKQIDNIGEWQIELELPWNYMLPSGSKPEDLFEYLNRTIGFDVMFGDSDGSDPVQGARDAMLALDHDGLMGDEDNAWQDVRKFGLLELQINHSPVTFAHAGDDIQITSDGNSEYPINLTGIMSRGKDNSPLDFDWLSLNEVSFVDSAVVSPSVTLPFSGFTFEYTFVLTVTDTNNVSDNDTVKVLILNNPPVADAGENQNVLANEMVTLDGSSSSDIEQSQLTYSWKSLNDIELSNANSAFPTFIAPESQNDTLYRFTLTVNDGEYDSESDIVTIFVPKYTTLYSNSEENICIYPNPANQNLQIHIDGKDCNQYLFIVTDINGKQIYKGKITGTKTTINTLECGIKLNKLYFIQVYNNEDVLIHTEKIIVQ